MESVLENKQKDLQGFKSLHESEKSFLMQENSLLKVQNQDYLERANDATKVQRELSAVCKHLLQNYKVDYGAFLREDQVNLIEIYDVCEEAKNNGNQNSGAFIFLLANRKIIAEKVD